VSFASPENLSEFFERLAAGVFPGGAVPDDFLAFQHQCESRYAAGEAEFGDAWRHRDNRTEALEEAADLTNYAAFDHFQRVADAGDDEDFALVLTAAHHGYLAHKAFCDLAARRTGAP
jgi:hypothetical protein